MRLQDDKRQKNQLQQSQAFPETGRSEAPQSSRRGTETSVAKHTIPINVRILAATNRDLEEGVQQGTSGAISTSTLTY